MIDILFIAPQSKKEIFQNLETLASKEEPTWLLLLAQYCRQKGLSVGVIDGQFYSYEEISKKTEELAPTLIHIVVMGAQPSSSSQCIPAAQKTSEAVKNLNPTRKIMWSGTTPAAIPEKILQEFSNCVDYVCDREGFKTSFLLISYLKDSINIDDIPDLWYKSRTTESVLNIRFTKRGNLLDAGQLDEIGTPAWDLVEINSKLDHYKCHNWHSFGQENSSPYASLYSSFGCAFKCSFCCINSPFGDMLSGSRPYRLISPRVTFNQIKHLYEKYGITNIKFVDEMFVLNKKHVLELCDLLIQSGLGEKINIWAYGRVDTCKNEFLEPLRKAGFNWLCLGIESGSEHVRDGADKVYSDDDIRNVVKRIQSHGVNIIANYIFGLPDDDLASMQRTYDLAYELNCEFANFYSAMYYVGSPLYYDAIKNNKQLPPLWNGYSQHSYECFPSSNEYCSNKEILSFRDNAHMNYFSRIEYQEMILKKFGQKALDEVKLMLSLGKPRRKILEI